VTHSNYVKHFLQLLVDQSTRVTRKHVDQGDLSPTSRNPVFTGIPLSKDAETQCSPAFRYQKTPKRPRHKASQVFDLFRGIRSPRLTLNTVIPTCSTPDTPQIRFLT